MTNKCLSSQFGGFTGSVIVQLNSANNFFSFTYYNGAFELINKIVLQAVRIA
jgi:hypothetical protein